MATPVVEMKEISALRKRWLRYPRYKDSGVEWLGEVPEEWDLIKIKYCSISQVGYPFKSEMFSIEPIGVKLLRGDNITEGKLRWGDKTRYWSEVTSDLEKYLLKPNDIVISMDGSKVGKNYAKIDESELPLLLVQRVTRLKACNPLQQDYLFYFFKDERFSKYVDGVKTDPAIPHITLKNIVDYIIPLPTSSEQHAIAAFLDRETSRIDALIAKKEWQIELLREKRSALISHAVTKGLDPNAKLKDSGIKWLGKVPEGWDIGRLKFVCAINPNKSKIAHLSKELEVSFLPMEKIFEDHTLCLDSDKPISEVWDGYTYFEEGDVILAKITPCFENGKCCLCSGLKNKIGFGTTELHVLRAKKSIIPRFCFYLLQSHPFKKIGTELMFGTTGQKRLPEDFVKNYKQGIPPLPEQHAIAAFLDCETARIDGIIDKIHGSIEKLNEYRSALISAAVTGKIDVRQEGVG